MDFFGILFDMKNGKKIPYSKTYFDTLFAAKLAEMQIKTLTGTLPLTFTAKGGTAADWVIFGNDDNGTENLFDYSQGCDWASGSNGASYQKIIAQQGDVFTVTSSSALYALVRGYDANDAIISGSAWSTGGKSTYTAPASIAYVKVVFRNFECSTTTAEQKATINESMLVKGSTAPDHYIPYQQGVGERTANLFDFQQFAGGTQTATSGGLTFTRDSDTIVVSNSSNATYPHVFLNDESGLTVPQLTQGQTYSGKLFISNAPSNSNIYIDVLGKNQGGDWTWIKNITVSGTSFTLSTAYDIYSYKLYCVGIGLSYENTRVKFVLTKGSTAPDHYVPYGFEIPLTINNTPQTFYIGDNPLTAGQSISKTSTGVDLELYEGENTVSTALYNKPTMTITYK